MIRSNFDIYEAAGGHNTATIVSASANVLSSNRFIQISFMNVLQYAKINAIEIKPYDRTVTEAPASSPVKVPTTQPTNNEFRGYLINCGYNLQYVDSLARTWLPDRFFKGGTPISNTFSIANTVDDPLYNYERAGDVIIYNLTVPIATFQVSLFFAETVFTSQNQRLFDISIENSVVEADVDLVRLAGGSKTAVRLQYFQLVEDGTLDILLSRSSLFANVSVPTISAIAVTLDKEHVAHAVAYGPYVGTVTNKIQNTALIELVGQTSHTHGEGLSLTEATWKEGNKILGTNLNVYSNFSAGEHTISLTVADSGGYTDVEVTSVLIKPFGYPAVTELNPSSGGLSGNYIITVHGTGFNYTANEITVYFGGKRVTGERNLTVVNSTALIVRVPSSIVSRSLHVVVQTPLGKSDSNTIASEFRYIDTIPILWTNSTFFSYSNPSVGRFGPDQRLYVGTRNGRLLRITMNEDFTRTISSLVVWVNSNKEAM
jgi:Malectin domain/IPT/TIG domain